MRATHETPRVPCAVATGLCRTGMPIVSPFVFSGPVAEGDQKSGLIGVVLAGGRTPRRRSS